MIRGFLEDTLELVLDLLVALRVLRRPREWYRQRIRRWFSSRTAGAGGGTGSGWSRICPNCGALNAASASRCAQCGHRLTAARARERAVSAWRSFVPSLGSASTTISALLITLFAALVVGSGDPAAVLQLPSDTLLRIGALVPFGYREFAWWRLLTAVFLHAGLMHLLFNVWALSSLGPAVEREIGSARLVVLFVASGAFGFLVSAAVNRGMSLGASGAIFGLIGFGLAWGQRCGIRMLRDEMLRWSVLGFVVLPLLGLLLPLRPDHAAHAGGFACGALLGLAMGGSVRRHRLPEGVWNLLALACGLVIVLAFAMAVRAALPAAA